VSRVYASLPLTGPAAGLGRAVLRGYGRLAVVDGQLVWDGARV
jgi:hypothetical protein